MGKISDTSVAEVVSKFGVNLDDNKNKLEEAFKKYDWLVGLHVHIGSHGMDPGDLAKGTKKVFEFAKTLHGIERFDMGGGLPVVYRQDDKKSYF